jgi:hypothetical protein
MKTVGGAPPILSRFQLICRRRGSSKDFGLVFDKPVTLEIGCWLTEIKTAKDKAMHKGDTKAKNK